MIKVGAITIGQSPRTDVTQDILPLPGDQVELLQAGGLDGHKGPELVGNGLAVHDAVSLGTPCPPRYLPGTRGRTLQNPAPTGTRQVKVSSSSWKTKWEGRTSSHCTSFSS